MSCFCVLRVPRWLLPQGVKLGVSSRGWASVVADHSKQRVLVDDDFQLITFDFVTEPSNEGAYLVPICKKFRYANTHTCLSKVCCCAEAGLAGTAVCSAGDACCCLRTMPCSACFTMQPQELPLAFMHLQPDSA